VGRRGVSAIFLVATWLVAGRARADLFDATHDLGFVRGEAFATFGSLPALALNGGDTPRRIVGAPTPPSSEVWHGVGAAFAVRADFLTWDIVSFRYSATGATFGGESIANNEGFNAAVGSLRTLEIGVPLCGIPSGFAAFIGRASQWKLAFALDVGFVHLWAAGEASSPKRAASSASIDDWTGYLRVSASGCRNLGRWTGDDPVAWLCLTVAPVVDGNGSNGVSLGARIEL
jgi:hypothetical protein